MRTGNRFLGRIAQRTGVMEKTKINEHIDGLCAAMLKLESVEQCRAFLDDLCTYKEVEQMAMRIYAAKLFLRGCTYSDIIDKTELSSATISRVSRALSHGSGGYRSVLEGDGKTDREGKSV